MWRRCWRRRRNGGPSYNTVPLLRPEYYRWENGELELRVDLGDVLPDRGVVTIAVRIRRVDAPNAQFGAIVSIPIPAP